MRVFICDETGALGAVLGQAEVSLTPRRTDYVSDARRMDHSCVARDGRVTFWLGFTERAELEAREVITSI